MADKKINTHEDGSLILESYGTNEQRLKVINEAIFKVLMGGQSYKIGSRELTRADLDILIAERDKIEAAMNAEKNSHLLSGVFAADFGYDNRR